LPCAARCSRNGSTLGAHLACCLLTLQSAAPLQRRGLARLHEEGKLPFVHVEHLGSESARLSKARILQSRGRGSEATNVQGIRLASSRTFDTPASFTAAGGLGASATAGFGSGTLGAAGFSAFAGSAARRTTALCNLHFNQLVNQKEREHTDSYEQIQMKHTGLHCGRALCAP
jgi:hypothetical protein